MGYAGIFTNFSPERAAEIAAALNLGDEGEDDWKYVVKQNPGAKYAYIEIYDETGEFVGRL